MSEENEQRPPLPPFDEKSAIRKVRLAEDAWNTRDPERVAPACTVDSYCATERTLSRAASRSRHFCSASGRLNWTSA